jgi:hypothetical protein
LKPRSVAAFAVEHGLGEVGQRHVVTQAGEVESGVTATGGNIENFGAGRKRHFFGGSANVIDVLQDMTLAIAVALPRELFLGGALDFVEVHTRRNGMILSERRMAWMRLKPNSS